MLLALIPQNLRGQGQPSITTTSLPNGTVGAAYPETKLAATRGTPPYRWSITSGALPQGLALSADTIQGVPETAGKATFVVQVRDNKDKTDSQSLSITVNPGPLSISSASIPDGVIGTAYSVTLTASGGIPPYTWRVMSGNLPNGLSLSDSGRISGTPTAAGVSSVTIQVADNAKPAHTAKKAYSIKMTPPAVAIVTTSLPDAVVNSAYSVPLAASAGTPPYTWSIAAGSLPAGIGLSPNGLLSGTAAAAGTATFTVRVRDAQSQTDSHELTLLVGAPAPGLSLSGLPGVVDPAQQLPVNLVLSAPQSAALSGQLTISFLSNAMVPIDDPAVQFSTGSRSVAFTIPANGTSAVFPPQLSLLAGTVAGTIRLTANIENGPSNMQVGSVAVSAPTPRLTNVSLKRTATGLDVQITGYSAERHVATAKFTFSVGANAGTPQTVSLERNVESDFQTWYQNPSSAAFGSSFAFVQSFAVQGDTSQIDSVTVILTNSAGSTTSLPARVTPN